MAITVVGLGPGSSRLITREAWDALASAGVIYLRTAQHPAAAELPGPAEVKSFDYVYQTEPDFEAVYNKIVATLLERGRQADIVYAVPGHPHVGESTVTRLLDEAAGAGVPVRVLAGLSFVEPLLTALNIDALNGVQIVDGLDIAATHYASLHADTGIIVGQVYNRHVASEVKQALSAVYPEEHGVVLVHHAGEGDESLERLSLYEMDRSEKIDHLTSLYVPPLPSAATLPALAETVAVLRSPEGCPWDIEQTSLSMRDGLLEEAYEVLQAIDEQDSENLREELGDLLYHIVMQAQIAAEEGLFTLSEVIAGIEAKLKRRHPHVWGDWQVNSTAEVLRNWDNLKAAEKTERQYDSALDNILIALPALVRSQKIQSRAGKVGFDWPDVSGIYEKIDEEIDEIKAASSPEEQQAELGDLLFAAVNLARHYDLDAEAALREANLRFEQRFRIVENLARQRRLAFNSMSLDEMNVLWEEAKDSLAKAEKHD
ncbi:MAG: nucleoside triphosphate pyrophosphohydrolase [Candidatus Promineifilaceae bacterium]